jgi:hypothetical protein
MTMRTTQRQTFVPDVDSEAATAAILSKAQSSRAESRGHSRLFVGLKDVKDIQGRLWLNYCQGWFTHMRRWTVDVVHWTAAVL